MISKRIRIAPQSDNYGHLAAYIADAGHKGEKSLVSWCAGCLGGDDYAEGIAEVLHTQAKNTRAKGAKTYHLVVSFRPEDEDKLSPEIFRKMEERFSEALGWAGHQRHCGVHKNTGNLHMHMAYNMVNPDTFTLHKEFRDFWIRDTVCRELEREFDLVIDKGRERPAPKQERQGEKAALVEAHTGQQSFETYARAHRESILSALEKAAAWQELHEAMAVHGMEIRPHGNGLVVKDRHGKQAVKASALDRNLSLKKLEARLGPYAASAPLEHVRERSRYQAVPLHRSPERGELYARYQAGIETRKTTLAAVKEREDADIAAIREQWAAKRREIERMQIAKRNRRNLLALARKHEAEAIAKARLAFQPQREAVRREAPFTSWNGFLRHEAENGDEVALAILRSREAAVEPERAETPAAPAKDWSRHGQAYATKAEVKAEHAEKERALLERQDISGKGKQQLQAFLRMERTAAEARAEGWELGPIARRVDGRGIVIFTLESGGGIRDSGKEIFYSGQDEKAHAAALAYASLKWGKKIALEQGKILFRQPPEIQPDKERGTGWSR